LDILSNQIRFEKKKREFLKDAFILFFNTCRA